MGEAPRRNHLRNRISIKENRPISRADPHNAISNLDKALEAAVLLRSSEAGYARDYRKGHAFGPEGDRCRLDAFTLGLLDTLAPTLDGGVGTLPLLIYLNTLLDHGPGATCRAKTIDTLSLIDKTALRRYVAGGRRQMLRILSNSFTRPGLFAELLEEELRDS